MIRTVTMEKSTYADIPSQFEAGTPPIVEAVGLGAAVDYLGHVGMDNVRAHEEAITGYLLEGLAARRRRLGAGPARRRRSAGERSASSSTGCTRTTSASSSTAAASPYARGTTARKPAHARFGVQASVPRVVVPLHDAGGDRRARRGVGVHQEVLPGGLMTTRPRRDVPGDHPGPLQAPPQRGAARALRGGGAPRQPDLRRRGDAARAPRRHGRRTRSSRTCRTTRSAARSARRRSAC